MKIKLEDAWFTTGVKTDEFELPDHWTDYDIEIKLKEHLIKFIHLKWSKEDINDLPSS